MREEMEALWDSFDVIFQKEVLRFISSFVLLLLAWGVGQGLTVSWNIRQKQKENDLTTARDFHLLYGEFFAIWKLWNYLIRDVGPSELPELSRCDLLTRICESEGRLESTLVRIACERSLTNSDIEVLGKFRQLYQQLRQSIRDRKPLKWDSSEHPDYVAFKTLAPKVASLIVNHSGASPQVEEPSEALKKITSNKWEHHIYGF
ncbi:MAG: hypothetical protein HQL52_01860 [Magnetococcales bacterium]|nr:hypothetical protein [Magnetococcales bacterium]